MRTENKEIWFDDVDVEDIERASGKKLKCFSEAENRLLVNSNNSLKSGSIQINDTQDNPETETIR